MTGYVLGKGDCTILDTDFEVKNGEHTYYVHYQEVVPENPHKGDVTGFADGFRMYDGNRWREFVEIIDYNRLENKPKINGVALLGDMDADDFGLAEKSELSAYALSSDVSAEYTSLELFNQTLGNLESIINGI